MTQCRRHRLRRIAHAKGERLPEEVKGTHHTKALPIDDFAQQRIIEGRVRKKVGTGRWGSWKNGKAIQNRGSSGNGFVECCLKLKVGGQVGETWGGRV